MASAKLLHVGQFEMSSEQIDCFQALYRSNYEAHKKLVPERVVGTLNWFFQPQKYLNWQKSPGVSALWVSANAGCGKSVLASSVVDELCSNEIHKTSHAPIVCYFFFKEDDETRASAEYGMSSILHQIIDAKNELITAVMPAYRAKKDQFVKDFDALWKIFCNTISLEACPPIFCILDGLDECSAASREAMVRAIVDAVGGNENFPLHLSSQKIQFLMTSRPLPSIERSFSRLPTIRLKAENEVRAIEQDINHVISKKVNEIADSKHLSAEFCQEIKETLRTNADRTFLWLSLVLQQIELSARASQRALRLLIKTLPQTLDETYENILADTKYEDYARKLLHILVAATRPLTLQKN